VTTTELRVSVTFSWSRELGLLTVTRGFIDTSVLLISLTAVGSGTGPLRGLEPLLRPVGRPNVGGACLVRWRSRRRHRCSCVPVAGYLSNLGGTITIDTTGTIGHRS